MSEKDLINDTDVCILCGGLGTRLRKAEDAQPKAMVDINGRPFLDILMENLRFQGVKRIILCTGYKAHFIEDYYRDKDIDVIVDFSRELEPLGTGGAVVNALEIISSEEFIVLNGDSFCPVSLQALLQQHRQNKAAATIAAYTMEHTDDYGRLLTDDMCNVLSFKEKEQGAGPGLVNTGIYCLSKGVFDVMPEVKRFSLENDLFPRLINHGLYAFLTQEKFWDIGTPERLKNAREQWKQDF